MTIDAQRHDALLYPIQEATQRLGIGRSTMYSEIKAGRIEVVKIGRRTLVPATALDDYVRELRAS